MGDRWTERLSEYLDGELADGERREMEVHLSTCAECAGVLAELRAVVARARALPERAPATDLWPGIAARLGEDLDVAGTGTAAAAADDGPRPGTVFVGRIRSARGERTARRRVSFTWPQLVAAGLALAFVSAGTAWLLRGGHRAPDPGSLARQEQGAAPGLAASEASYEVAIAELRRALAEGRGRLDPATVKVLEENLTLIERSIDQARRALAADPANPYLREHLEDTMRRKLELLERATLVASAR